MRHTGSRTVYRFNGQRAAWADVLLMSVLSVRCFGGGTVCRQDALPAMMRRELIEA